MANYGYVVDTLLPQIANKSYVLEEIGVTSYEDLRKRIDLLAPFELLKTVIGMMNNFPNISPLLSAITEVGEAQIISEKYFWGEFEKGTDMAKGTPHKVVTRSIAIPVDNYSFAVRVDQSLVA